MAENRSATITRSRKMINVVIPFLPFLFARVRTSEMAASAHAIAFATTKNLKQDDLVKNHHISLIIYRYNTVYTYEYALIIST